MLNHSKHRQKHNSEGFLIETSFQDTLRILFVDDNHSFLRVSKLILEMKNNFEVDTVASVDEALNKMETKTYDAVVSDYQMPMKNGSDLLKQLKQEKNKVPFIFFTCHETLEVEFKTSEIQPDRCMCKNGSPEVVFYELAEAIYKTVESRKQKP